MTAAPIIQETWIPVPPARAWEALTKKEEMKEWYFDLEAFEPRVGFTFTFTGGKDDRVYVHRCRITEVIPERLLAHTWTYDGFNGESIVQFELEEARGGTLIRLTHSGLESFAGQHPDLHPDNFREGWAHIIGTSLKNYLS